VNKVQTVDGIRDISKLQFLSANPTGKQVGIISKRLCEIERQELVEEPPLELKFLKKRVKTLHKQLVAVERTGQFLTVFDGVS